ncbi:MAG TPA: glycoside hydrolase family 5 protein [Patescibacteria group bacterium]
MARTLRRQIGPSKAPVPRGLNMSGLEMAPATLPGVEGTNYTKNTQQDFNYVRNKGFNIVRVPFLWERAQPTVGGALDATYMGYLDTIINTWASGASLKVLLECHNFGGRDVSGVNRKIGSAQLTQANFTDLWTKVATRYVGNANVWGYDLMNEPNAMPVQTTPATYNTTATWTLAANAAIVAIRAVDTGHYIVAETDNWSGLQNFVGDYGANPTPWFTDSVANKLYYSWHYYFDSDHSGTYAGANAGFAGSGLGIQAGGDFLITVATWVNNRGLTVGGYPALFLGEYGVPNNNIYIGGTIPTTDEAYLSALSDFMNVMDAYNIAGTHWATGQWYSAVSTAQPNSPLVPAIEADQMKILQNHLGTINY